MFEPVPIALACFIVLIIVIAAPMPPLVFAAAFSRDKKRAKQALDVIRLLIKVVTSVIIIMLSLLLKR